MEDENEFISAEKVDYLPPPKKKSTAAPKTEIDIAVSETQTNPPKTKKAQTDKQKEATKKMMTALKERRETMKKAKEEEEEMLKAEKDELKVQARQRDRLEKAKYQKKKLPPPAERPPYITAAELQKFKLEMMDMVGKPQKIIKEKEVEVEKIVERPTIVEKVIEKPTTKVISGNALLDAIFFK